MVYYAPDAHEGMQGLIPVPTEAVDRLLEEKYPDPSLLFNFTPPTLTAQINHILDLWGLTVHSLDLNNIWPVFTEVLTILRTLYVDLDEPMY